MSHLHELTRWFCSDFLVEAEKERATACIKEQSRAFQPLMYEPIHAYIYILHAEVHPVTTGSTTNDVLQKKLSWRERDFEAGEGTYPNELDKDCQ